MKQHKQPVLHAPSLPSIAFVLILLAFAITVAADDKICDHCDKKITDNHWIEFEGSFFHTNHFLCANCGGDLRNGMVYVEEGQMYDSTCYFDLFVPKCAHCGKPIVGNYAEYDSKLYHQSCYEESIGPRCAICGKTLYGAYMVDHRGNSFHKEHAEDYPTCAYCGSILAPELTGSGETYRDGRSVCGLCLKTAVNDINEGKAIMAEIIKTLDNNDIDINDNNLPLELVDRDKMLRKAAGFHEDPAGFTSYRKTSVVPGVWSHKDFKIYVLEGMPRAEFLFTLAHELMHVWLFKNAPDEMSSVLTEGSCQYAAILALLGQSQKGTNLVFKRAMEDDDPIYGEGLRQVDAYVKRVGVPAWLEYLKDHTDPPW